MYRNHGSFFIQHFLKVYTKPQRQYQLLEKSLRPSSGQDPCQEAGFSGGFKIALNGNFRFKNSNRLMSVQDTSKFKSASRVPLDFDMDFPAPI